MGTVEDIEDDELTIFITAEAGEKKEFQITPGTAFYLEDEEIGLEELKRAVRQGKIVTSITCFGVGGEEAALIVGTIGDIEDIDDDELHVFITTEDGERMSFQITPRTAFYMHAEEIELEELKAFLPPNPFNLLVIHSPASPPHPLPVARNVVSSWPAPVRCMPASQKP